MPDDVPRSRFSFIDARTRDALWEQWQALRRHRDYPTAVLCCRQGIAAHLDSLDPTLVVEGLTLSNFLRDLDDLNVMLHHPLPPEDETFPPMLRFGPRQALGAQCNRLGAPTLREALPLLARFAADWGITLPLASDIAALPDFVAAIVFPRDYDIKLIHRHRPSELVIEFTIRPGASHEVLSAQFQDILAANVWLPNASRRRHRRKRIDAAQAYRAYDLRLLGSTYQEIAQQLWPKDWALEHRDYPHKHRLVQRAQDYVAWARKRIRKRGM